MDKYSYVANAHVSYIDELYESFKKDPQSVDSSWQQLTSAGYETVNEVALDHVWSAARFERPNVKRSRHKAQMELEEA